MLDYFIGFLSPDEIDSPYTVSEINHGIAETLSASNTLVWVEGEVSGYKHHSSGHAYFRLKDEKGHIPAVIWKTNISRFPEHITNGMFLSVIASIRVYERGGYYQLDIHRGMEAGVGSQHRAYEELKIRLEQEGLFDSARKRPIPSVVHRIGVVTAKTGAALYDILTVVGQKAPHVDVVLSSAIVQGLDAPSSLVAALKRLNRLSNIDVIIFGRGGGSAEDLSAFNDEKVVRAVAASKIPVISAVGHEIDFSLSDFAADLRAATPSVAAELLLQQYCSQKDRVDELILRFSSLVRMRLREPFRTFQQVYRSIPYHFRRHIRRYSDEQRSLEIHIEHFGKTFLSCFTQKREELIHKNALLNAFNPDHFYQKGLILVKTMTGKPIRGSAELHRGQDLLLHFPEDTVEVTVTKLGSEISS